MAMTGSTPCSSMSNHTKERVTMTKVTLENFYSNLIAQHEEREMRCLRKTGITRGRELPGVC
uniref:Serine/threonine kinase 38 n=1 Tax=Mus musculus TaxID=10090 RepID=A0A3B2W7M3_MOUSE